MSMFRENIFFRSTDMTSGFESRGDGNTGLSVKVLASDLDTTAKRGHRTRILRMDPGSDTPEAHAHDYWEEILILEGEMIVQDGTDGEKIVRPGDYAARKPGVMHGPVRGDTGCLMVDFCWYPDPDEK